MPGYNPEFNNWLIQNGLTESFTTNAGDSFFTNMEKRFGVIKKADNYNVQSFYLDDIIEFKTLDERKVLYEWGRNSIWRTYDRISHHSTSNVYMKIWLRNGQTLIVQIFRATNGNISRSSNDYINLINYAGLLSQIIYNCANRPMY